MREVRPSHHHELTRQRRGPTADARVSAGDAGAGVRVAAWAERESLDSPQRRSAQWGTQWQCGRDSDVRESGQSQVPGPLKNSARANAERPESTKSSESFSFLEAREREAGGCVGQACTVGVEWRTIRVISQHLSQNFRGLLNAMSSCACDSTVSDLALLKVLTGPAVLPMLCGLRNRMARPAASPRRHAALRNRHRTRSPTCTTAAYCAWTPAEAAALITSTAAASVRERSSCNLAERLATCALSRARSSAASWS